MSTTRAIRRFLPGPVPRAVIESLVQAASWAPSGGNLQPWRVVVVTDPEVLQELGQLDHRPEPEGEP